MKFYDKLKEAYGYDNPIVIKDMKDYEISNEALRKQLSNLAKEGKIKRSLHGVYYIPSNRDKVLEANDIIEYKYIKNKSKVFGFYSGEKFLVELQIKEAYVNQDIIITNHEKTRKRLVKILDKEITLKRPYCKITKGNYRVLKLLYLINEQAIDFIYTYKEILINYIIENEITRNELLSVIESFPKKTNKRLIVSDLNKYFID